MSPRLAIAASLCVALVAAGCASTFFLTPSPIKPQIETFVSGRYGFSVTLPTGSLEQDATVDWDGSCLCGLDDPAWDHVSLDSRTLVVGATAIDSGVALARWQAYLVKLAPAVCHDSEAATEVPIGGEDALQWTASCSDGYNVIKLAALHGGWGYVVLFASPSSDAVADNQAAFDSLMSSFKYA